MTSHKSYHIVLPVHKANHKIILEPRFNSNQKSIEKDAIIHNTNDINMLIVVTYFFLTSPSYQGFKKLIIVVMIVATTTSIQIFVIIVIIYG